MLATAHPGTLTPHTPTSCDAAAVGQRLRVLRREAGLTQLDLALRLGTTQSAVARLEAGRQRLSLAALQRAATELGCDVTVVISEQRPVA
jgi:UDP-N-acetylglucosamine 1-carboxyvinyltransferase